MKPNVEFLVCSCARKSKHRMRNHTKDKIQPRIENYWKKVAAFRTAQKAEQKDKKSSIKIKKIK